MPQEELVAVLRAELSQFREGMEEAARIARETQARIRREAKESAEAFAPFKAAIDGAKQALAAFGVTVGVGALVKLGKDAVDIALKMQTLQTTLRAVTGSVAGANQALDFVRATAARLGQDVLQSAQSFASLTAAARGTALEGEKTRQIFTAVSEASRVLGLSADNTNGVLNALVQIMSKGTVQSEELRGQIGDRLPGAFQIAARAMGATTAEFGRMLEQGLVISDEFLPKFAAQLRKELGGGVEDAAKQASAAFGRLASEVQVFAANVGHSVLSILQPLATFTTEALGAINKVSAARQAEEERFKARNPLVFSSLPPSSLAEDVGVDRARQAATLRAAILPQQQQLEALVRELETTQGIFDIRQRGVDAGQLPRGVLVEAQRELQAVTVRLAEQKDRVEALTKAYTGLLTEQEKIKNLSATGFPDETPLLPKAADVDKFRGLMKQLGEEIKQQDIGLSLFGGSLPADEEAKLDARFDRAQERLKALTKTADDLAQAFVKSPGFLETLQPEQLKALEKFQGDLAVARMRVDELTDARKAFKEGETAAKRAADQAASEEERLAGERVDLFTKAQKAEEAYAKQAIEDAYELVKARTTALAGEEDYLAAQEDGLRKLDQIEARSISQFEARRERLRQQVRDYEEAFGASEKSAAALASGLARINEDETKKNKEELDKQNKDYERFAKQVTSTVSDQLFAILSGKVETFKDLLGSIKTVFLRVLADMVAAAAVSGLFGTGGGVVGALINGTSASASTGGAGGASAGGLVGTALTAAGYLKSAYGLFGSLFGGAAVSAAEGTALLGASAPTVFYGTTEAVGAAALSGGASGAGGLSGLSALSLGGGVTLGTAATGAGLGIGAGLLASQLFGAAGLHGTANRTLSGATGGAIAGTVVAPGIGTIVGAVVGALGGWLSGVLGRGPAPPGVTIAGRTGTRPGFGLDDGGLTIATTSFRPDISGRQLKPEALQILQNGIAGVTQEITDPIVKSLRTLPTVFQSAAQAQLNSLGEALGTVFANVKFEGDNLEEQVKTFLEKDLPEKVQTVFAPFNALLEKVGPIFQTAAQLVNTLEQQANTILSGIAGVRARVNDSGQSNLSLFKQRRSDLDTLVQELLTNVTPQNEARRVALGSQITGLVGQLSDQGSALFRAAGDDAGLAGFKATLNEALNAVEASTRSIFGANIQQAEQQIELLSGIFNSQQSVEDLTAQVVTRLDQIAALLTPVGSFQTDVGQVKRIPRTGLALVHEGELIGRPGSGGSIVVNVDARGASDPQAIGRTTASAIRQTLRELQLAGRYRQNKGL